MKNNGENRNFLIRASEQIANHSWFHFLSSLCIGIWAYFFFSMGGGFVGGVGFGVLCFVAAYVGIAALPASVYEAIRRPWLVIVPILVLFVLLAVHIIL